MTPVERAKILFTVESSGSFINHPHNARFRVTEQPQFCTDSFASGSILAEGESSTPAPDIQPKTYLCFSVDNVGDQTTFLFGGDGNCDILIHTANPISNRLFALQLEHDGRIALLKNLSSRGINVNSPIYKHQRVRSQRALVPGDDLKILLSGFDIIIQFLDHEDEAGVHNFYLEQLARRTAGAVPSITRLNLETKQSSTRTRGNHPYNLHTEIGSGAYGTVYRAIHSYTGALVAIKVFRKPESKLLEEATILQSLSHPNIVRFIAFIWEDQALPMMVMELLDHPNLEQAQKQHALTKDQTRDLLAKLLHGLAYLHSMHITHRDLKPANIILVSRAPVQLKLTDFGLAVARSHQLTTHCGTLPYLAPEVHSRSYTNKADLWSVGVIALELSLGLPDYPSKHKIWPSLLKDRLQVALVDATFYGFVKPLLQFHAHHRPSAQECLDNHFFHVILNSSDAVGSPTEYAPSTPHDRAHSCSSYISLESNAVHPQYRSQNAPSPPDHDLGSSQAVVPFAGDQLPAQGRDLANGYWSLVVGEVTVMYRPDDGLINLTQLLKANGHKPVKWSTIEKRLGAMHRAWVHGRSVIGNYVSLIDAQRVLQNLRLPTSSIQDLSNQIQRLR